MQEFNNTELVSYSNLLRQLISEVGSSKSAKPATVTISLLKSSWLIYSNNQLQQSPDIEIGFTFLVPAHPGSPGKKAVKWVYVCMYVPTTIARMVIKSRVSRSVCTPFFELPFLSWFFFASAQVMTIACLWLIHNTQSTLARVTAKKNVGDSFWRPSAAATLHYIINYLN